MENNKYQNGKIYRVTDIGYNLFYYGSTIQELSQRMGGHRRTYKNYKEGKYSENISVFKTFEEYGMENCKIELVETYPCNNKDEMYQREGYHIRNNDCVNKIMLGRTVAEYYQDNADRIKEQVNEYRKNNQEVIKERKHKYYEENRTRILNKNKQYCEQNKDKMAEYKKEWRNQNKDRLAERDKIYRLNNKDKLQQYLKEYRTSNKEIINEQKRLSYEKQKRHLSERVICPVCGGHFTYGQKSRHERTIKHEEALKNE